MRISRLGYSKVGKFDVKIVSASYPVLHSPIFPIQLDGAHDLRYPRRPSLHVHLNLRCRIDRVRVVQHTCPQPDQAFNLGRAAGAEECYSACSLDMSICSSRRGRGSGLHRARQDDHGLPEEASGSVPAQCELRTSGAEVRTDFSAMVGGLGVDFGLTHHDLE